MTNQQQKKSNPTILTEEQYVKMALGQICHQRPELYPNTMFWINNEKYKVDGVYSETDNFSFSGEGTLNFRKIDTGDILMPKKVSFNISLLKSKDHNGLPTVILQNVKIDATK